MSAFSAFSAYGVRLRAHLSRFARKRDGNVTVTFGLSVIPAMLLVGSSIDYTNATADRSVLQKAVDAAALEAVRVGTVDREEKVGRFLRANLYSPSLANVTFRVLDAPQGARVEAEGVTSTSAMRLANVNSVVVHAGATAMGLRRDNSCILAMARNLPVSTQALDFNGSPSVALTGCGMMSNASISCSGHSTQTPYASAVGTISGSCPNQTPGRDPIPDIYDDLVSHIQPVCSSVNSAINWNAGAALPLPGMIPVARAGYVEYHVCGSIRLRGAGALNTLTNTDVVIVVENGDIQLDNGADVSSSRMTFVMTGSALHSHRVTWPNGNGNSARFAVSPSTNLQNPWHGIALYQDPRLPSSTIDMVWGPAASFDADGVIYFGAASLTMNGNASSNNSLCTKIVTNQFTSNGNIDFRFSQDTAACRNLAVTQWESPPRLVR